MLLAAVGGTLFVRGLLAAASRLRLPPSFIGITFAAFATSGPELVVAILASLQEASALALGNALGANVANLGLVLGIGVLFAGMRIAAAPAGTREILLIAAPLAVATLLADGQLSRWDAAWLLAAFFAWLAYEWYAVWRGARPSSSDPGPPRDLLVGVAGLALLFAAGEAIVSAARELARLWSVDAYFIGATLVALGTCTPELATTIAARARGHHDLGLATLVGSTSSTDCSSWPLLRSLSQSSSIRHRRWLPSQPLSCWR